MAQQSQIQTEAAQKIHRTINRAHQKALRIAIRHCTQSTGPHKQFLAKLPPAVADDLREWLHEHPAHARAAGAAAKIEAKLKQGRGTRAALSIATGFCTTNPDAAQMLLGMLDVEFAIKLADEIQISGNQVRRLRPNKQAKLQAKVQARREQMQQDEAEEAEFLSKLKGGLETARQLGMADRYLAALAPFWRNQIGGGLEILAAIELRRTAMPSVQVRSILGCTHSELSRWARDGRLPVLFRREVLKGDGYGAETSYWASRDVAAALPKVAQWIEQDKANSGSLGQDGQPL